MKAKELAFGSDARTALKAGVTKLARAVKSTLGARGRTAVLDRGYGAPTVTKDGVTVAREIESKDPGENMAVQLMKECATKTSDVAGDGTTTATVLAEARFLEAGADPMGLGRGVQKAVETITARALELGCLGVDIVLDAHLRPVVLGANARPRQAVQIANRIGLQRYWTAR